VCLSDFVITFELVDVELSERKRAPPCTLRSGRTLPDDDEDWPPERCVVQSWTGHIHDLAIDDSSSPFFCMPINWATWRLSWDKDNGRDPMVLCAYASRVRDERLLTRKIFESEERIPDDEDESEDGSTVYFFHGCSLAYRPIYEVYQLCVPELAFNMCSDDLNEIIVEFQNYHSYGGYGGDQMDSDELLRYLDYGVPW
jgi:hypothetical protein